MVTAKSAGVARLDEKKIVSKDVGTLCFQPTSSYFAEHVKCLNIVSLEETWPCYEEMTQS